ncbi:MAG: DUF2325 domain-containing protein [Archangiaceae bacterium]|nr:DUF2325 domain-containing protein [Archangiaceae bacterium]
MRIGVVGGVERTEAAQQRLAEQYGHELLFHPGHMAGRGSSSLESLVRKCDLVVILTDVNSHGAVLAARKFLRAYGMTPLLVRRLGLSRLEELLRSLSTLGTAAALG